MRYDDEALTSVALVYSQNGDLCTAVGRTLHGQGWSCRAFGLVADAMVYVGGANIALAVLDTRADGAEDFLYALRGGGLPGLGTPVLQAVGERWGGVNAAVPFPCDDAVLTTAIERLTGPLGDHALRAAPFSPLYQLTRLMGAPDAILMMAQFAVTLREALADCAVGALSAERAHRISGVAGTIGFYSVSKAWRAVEIGEPGAIDAAIVASRQALASLAQAGVV